ncbi:MAG: hypothetical protein HYR66_17320 [Sphingobacteriales bacterium]|nr:hypothetical protein [Sphingobacteriales bacterium]MBI3718229.1 hypothetical protein [Sphingobacteriales bacterium]
MNRHLLTLFLLACFCTSVHGQLTYPKVRVDFDSVIAFGNLELYPVHFVYGGQPYEFDESTRQMMRNITNLKKALGRRKIKIMEKGNLMYRDINSVVVENNSDQHLLLLGGELLAGGRQDRIIAKDTILPPRSGKTEIKVYCVEDSRWSKEKKFKHAGYADASLKKMLDSTASQKKIWNEIRKRFRKRKIFSQTNSYLALLGEKLMTDTSGIYFQNLLPEFRSSDSSMIGFVAVTGNQVLGADVFISPELFYNNLEVTLRLYIDAAVMNGSPPVMPVKNIKDYCEQLFNPNTQEKFLRRYGNVLRYNGQVVHITGY